MHPVVRRQQQAKRRVLRVSGIEQQRMLSRQDPFDHPAQRDVRKSGFGISAADIAMNARKPDLFERLLIAAAFGLIFLRSRRFVPDRRVELHAAIID